MCVEIWQKNILLYNNLRTLYIAFPGRLLCDEVKINILHTRGLNPLPSPLPPTKFTHNPQITDPCIANWRGRYIVEANDFTFYYDRLLYSDKIKSIYFIIHNRL